MRRTILAGAVLVLVALAAPPPAAAQVPLLDAIERGLWLFGGRPSAAYAPPPVYYGPPAHYGPPAYYGTPGYYTPPVVVAPRYYRPRYREQDWKHWRKYYRWHRGGDDWDDD